jgi:hypothetical protein
MPENVGIKVYADDVKIYVSHKNDEKRDDLSLALSALENWSKNNGIKISAEKTFILYLGHNNSKKTYFLNESALTETDCVRDLGVLIDPKLSFTDHIQKIVKNAYFTCHQMLKALNVRKLQTYILIYKSYIRPHLEYATEVWNPSKKEHIQKIEKVQKFFTRIILKRCGIVSMPYDQRLKVCGLQKLENRRKVNDLVSTFKILKKHTHLIANQFFTIAKRSLRKPLLLQNRKYTTKSKNNFFNRVINSWNSLPKNVTEINDTKRFRKLAKEFVE